MAKRELTRTLFLDADGITRDFERWSYKRVSTAKEKTVKLYRMMTWHIKDLQERGVVTVSFGTVNPDTSCNEYDYTEQESMSFSEFIQIVEGSAGQ